MDAREKLTKARIKLQADNPFFSYLSLYLDFKESKELPEWAGMGVNAKGELFYKKDFVEKLSNEEVIGVLAHEILHLALLHLIRVKKRDMKGWNISTDLVINSLLRINNFYLPSNSITPNYYNEFKFNDIIIENIDKKTAEQIYDELPKDLTELSKAMGYENGGGFDEHILSEELNEEKERALKEEWENRVSEAYVNAKERGLLPNGIERLIGELHKESVDWRTLLRRYIIKMLPSDFSYKNRDKKSASLGVYFPEITKEKINIAIAIDTSGSIGKKELTDFLSEIIGIAKAYKNQIDMRLYTHDYEVQDSYDIENGHISKIMKIEIKGGGGTSHKPVITKINKEIRDCQAVIFFTDGYSDLYDIDFKKNRFQSIFILNKEGTDNQIINKGVTIIKLK